MYKQRDLKRENVSFLFFKLSSSAISFSSNRFFRFIHAIIREYSSVFFPSDGKVSHEIVDISGRCSNDSIVKR